MTIAEADHAGHSEAFLTLIIRYIELLFSVALFLARPATLREQ
jgi:hypothetical protein